MTDHLKTIREALQAEQTIYRSEDRFVPPYITEALAAIDALEAENARLKDLLGKANTLARIRWERLCQLQGRSINEDNSDQQGYTAADMASAAAQGFRDGQAAQQAQAEAVPQPFHELLKEADTIVRSKPHFQRRIEGTPLENDIAVWMATFAEKKLAAAPQPKENTHE